MAYNPDIPAPTDVKSQSQADIKENFTQIKTVVDINHVTFGDADQGKHKYVTLPEQGAAPSTAANEIALYTKEIGGVSALFLRHEGDGTEVDITTATKAAAGYCKLPCGIMLIWGSGNMAGGTKTQAQGFVTNFSTSCLNVQVTATSDPSGDAEDGIFRAGGFAVNQFTVGRMNSKYGTACSYNFLAIGY